MLLIDVKVWKSLKQSTFFNIKDLLKSADILNKINQEENKEWLSWHPWVAGGLYTYAIEEFGKLLYLMSLTPENDRVKIDYDEKFKGHPQKFRLALENLPNECKLLHSGSFNSKNFNSSNYDTDTIADFQARLGIFYTDIDEKGNLKITPRVDAQTMNTTIQKFEEFIDDFRSKNEESF